FAASAYLPSAPPSSFIPPRPPPRSPLFPYTTLFRSLGGRPDVHPVRADVRRAVHRLHRGVGEEGRFVHGVELGPGTRERRLGVADRKSTRLNSSHEWISYAVFCLKKKKI